MASVIRITESELFDALAVAAKGTSPAEAKTVQELADEAGIHERAVRKALAAMKKAGRLVIHTVTREALDGRQCRIAGYTITPKRKA